MEPNGLVRHIYYPTTLESGSWYAVACYLASLGFLRIVKVLLFWGS